MYFKFLDNKYKIFITEHYQSFNLYSDAKGGEALFFISIIYTVSLNKFVIILGPDIRL